MDTHEFYERLVKPGDIPIVQSPIGVAVDQMIGLLEPHSVQTAVLTAIYSSNPEQLAVVIDQFRQQVVWSPIVRASPRWLNIKALIDELLKLNVPGMWEQIITDTHKKKKGITGTLTRGFHPYSWKEDPIPEIASEISKDNSRFYGLAIPYIGLAAVFGDTTEQVVRMRHNSTGSRDSMKRAMEELGTECGPRVSSSGELIGRLQHAFSTTSAIQSAYHLLHTNQAFEGLHGNPTKQRLIRCPAIGLTKMIFDTYSELLGTNFYQQKLNHSIKRK